MAYSCAVSKSHRLDILVKCQNVYGCIPPSPFDFQVSTSNVLPETMLNMLGILLLIILIHCSEHFVLLWARMPPPPPFPPFLRNAIGFPLASRPWC